MNYNQRFNKAEPYGDCLFNPHEYILFTKTGKFVDSKKFIYSGENRVESGFNEVWNNYRPYATPIINSASGPYFWFVDSITTNKLCEKNTYTYYDLDFNIIIYNRFGDFVDDLTLKSEYGYNKDKKDKEYAYDYYYCDEKECADKIEEYLIKKIKQHISSSTQSEESPQKEISRLQNNSSTSKQQDTPKKAKTRTISEPVQRWKDCGPCFGSGLCQYCSGSGVIYYPGVGAKDCAVCGGLKKCTMCAGRGGEYVTEYVNRTETYYE